MIYSSNGTDAAALAAAEELRAQVESELDSLPVGELGVLLHVVRGFKLEPIKTIALDPALLAVLRNTLPSSLIGIYSGNLFGIAAASAVGSLLASDVARRMLLAVPHEDTTMAKWNELIGPFYDTAALTEWLGVSKQAISKRIGKTLLAVRAVNGDVRYPSFQFMGDGHVIPNLMAVCQKLADAGVDEWGQAQWVNTPIAQLGDRTVAEALAGQNEEDTAIVMALAKSQAARLAA